MGQWIEQANAALSGWAHGLGWPLEQMMRLAMAALAGGLVGLEREVRGRQAGFRTNLLVCVGSALVMIVSNSLAARGQWGPTSGFQITVDPGRIAYGVMAGIGFLGAGTIMHTRGMVHGLTTAAGMWCVAAIGLGLGFGLYLVAAAAVALVVAALWLLDYLEALLPRVKYRTVTIRCKWVPGCIAEMVRLCEQRKLDVLDTNFQRSADLQSADISMSIAFIDPKAYIQFERQLESDDRYIVMGTHET